MTDQITNIANVQTVAEQLAGAMSIADAWVSSASKDYINFPANPAQVGATLQINRPATGFAIDGWDLTGNKGAVQQKVETLTLDNPVASSVFTAGQDYATTLVNNERLMDDFLRSNAIAVSAKIAQHAAASVAKTTYRAYSGGISGAPGAKKIDPITEMTQIREAANRMYDYGAQGMYNLILDSATNNSVVNSGLSKFTLNRNNEESQSWKIGDTENLSMLQTNILYTHECGDIGKEGTEMTLTGVSGDGNTLEFTDAAIANMTVKAGDIIEFTASNLHPVTYIGKIACSGQRVQARVRADATADTAGKIAIQPVLDNDNSLIDPNGPPAFVNISRPLVSSGPDADKAIIYPSHRAAVLAMKNTYFLGMPELDPLKPYDSGSEKVNGVSVRVSEGAVFNTAEHGIRLDALSGYTFLGENAMRIMLPV